MTMKSRLLVCFLTEVYEVIYYNFQFMLKAN